MKKIFVILCMVCSIIISATSCNIDKAFGCIVRSDIKKTLGCEVKGMKIEKIHIDTDFSEYSQESREATSHYIALSNTYSAYMNSANLYYNSFFDCCYWDLNLANDYKIEYEKYSAMADSVLKKVNVYKDTLDIILKKHKSGDVYVAKYKIKNEFGKWNKFNSYSVYTYNDKSEIYQYDGVNVMKIVLSVYPEAKDDIKNALNTALLDGLSTLNN